MKPTREQIVQWASDAGLKVGQHWNHRNMTTAFMTDFATLARVDLEATITEQAAEIERLNAALSKAKSECANWKSHHIEYARNAQEFDKENRTKLTEEQAKVAELQAIEANLCELHNVALDQIAVEQTKVKLLSEALTTVHDSCFMVADHDQLCMKALAAVKEVE